MNRKNKNIIMLVLALFIVYGAGLAVFIYGKYQNTIRETSLSTANLTKTKAMEISDYINSTIKTAGTISNMLASANEKYGYDMMPYINQALSNLVSENPEFSSFVVTWEYSEVNPEWFKPYGRYVMRSYLRDGLPYITTDTLDLEGEVGDESYYQMKTGTVKNLFTNMYLSNNESFMRTEARYVFAVATKIEVAGTFAGTVAVEIPLSKIEEILNRQSLELQGNVFVLTNNGKLAIHPNPDFINTFFKDAYAGIDQMGGLARQLSDGTLRTIDYTYSDRNIGFFDFSQSDHCRINFYPVEVKDNTTPWALGYEINYSEFRHKALSGVNTFIIITFFGLLLLAVFAYMFLSFATKPMREVDGVLQKLRSGDFDKISKLESSDQDTQKLYNSVNFLADRIMRTTKFARSMGKGDLEATFDSYDENNALDSALIEMQKNLLHARIEEKKRIEENEKLSWAQEGLAQIGEFLRMNNADINDFAFKIISYLVKYLGALQGAMFVAEERDGKKVLEQKATYAFDRKKQLTTTVEFGESLVGRCAIERKTIYMTDVPEGYLYITSGLGEKKPSCLLLVPLQFEDEVHGVIEIASLKEIGEYQIKFFDNVAERIASTISNIKKNINSAELLNKFSTQSNELARREKEIAASYSDIKKAQNEVRLSEREIVAILDVLAQTSIITRYDTTGVVLDLRDKTLDTTGYKKNDILGHNIRDVLALTKGEIVTFDLFWNDILNGKTKVRYFTRGSVKFRETFNLLYDNDNRPFKVISVAVPESNVQIQAVEDNPNAVQTKVITEDSPERENMQKF